MSNAFTRFSESWERRSLKFWLAVGMTMTFVPIFISAVTGYALYHRAIIRPLVGVASMQRYILQPLQSIQLSLQDVSGSVIDFALGGEARSPSDYQHAAGEIDTAFARLSAAFQSNGLGMHDVSRARDSWQKIRDLGNAILAHPFVPGDAITDNRAEKFEADMASMSQRLKVLHDDVRAYSEQVHDQALVDLVFYEYLSLAGFAVSLLFAVLGVVIINRTLVFSMNQLAHGAMRLAAGDWEHQIEVHLPHELVNVANAFNMMTEQIVEQIVEQERALKRTAATDGLTGLFNRRELDRMLTDEVRRAERYGTSVSLVMSDIDHFKHFNDTHGHQAGDEALRCVAQAMQGVVREVDKVCRFGGEEFTLILPACEPQAAYQMAERVRSAVAALPIVLDAGQIERVTLSLGVAIYPDNGTTPEALLKSADEALYRSKKAGRNRVTTAL